MADGVLIDTNVLLQYLLDEDPVHGPAALRFLASAAGDEQSLVVSTETLSEVVVVLAGRRYRAPRGEIVSAMRELLALPLRVLDRTVVAVALDLYEHHHPDWDDCLLAAYAMEHTGGRVASFDRGFDAIPGLQRLEPVP